MKKFFTLLFCVAGMAVAANAQDVTPVRQCIVSDGDPNVDDVTDAINKKMNKKE